MKRLSIDEVEAKIAQVDKDILLLISQGDTGRKVEVLREYREFLLDDLADARKQQKTS